MVAVIKIHGNKVYVLKDQLLKSYEQNKIIEAAIDGFLKITKCINIIFKRISSNIIFLPKGRYLFIH